MLIVDPHPYQNDAIDRAIERESLLVAYEMGTGKTVIALAVAEELLGLGEVGVCAIVVPANLKWQWAQQIAKLTDVGTMTKILTVDGVRTAITVPQPQYAVVVEGSKAQRDKQFQYILDNRPDYVILGYENVVNDWNMVRRIKPDMITLDECTAIKTFKAQRTKKIKRWSARYRLGLTGTPIDNGAPEELFSIMQWVDAEVLGRFDLFDKSYIVRNRFGGVQRYKNLPVLHAKLSEALVRKTRSDPDVAKYLPETQESTVWVDLDPKTRAAYEHIGADLLAELQSMPKNGESFDVFAHYHGSNAGAFENSQQGRIMSRMQALEMLLNEPRLIIASGQDYAASLQAKESGIQRKTWAGSKYCHEVWQSGVLDEISSSPKLGRLVEEVQRAVASSPDNKVIVFSYYRRMGRYIEEALDGIRCVQYHGEMSGAEKAAAVAQFKEDPDTRVIVCSHAGAFGTDLYMANYLFNYDLAWSAGTQDQINARHSRAASTFKHIYVVNLLSRRTTEARKPEVLEFKRRTASAILDNSGADDKGRIDNDLMTLTEYLSRTLQSAA